MFEKAREYYREIKNLIPVQQRLISLLPSARERQEILDRFETISKNVKCASSRSHVLSFVTELLTLPKDLPGCIVEAGAFAGGSSAKISIIAKYLGRKLIIFDSFEGLPKNDEKHTKSIFGYSLEGWFDESKFCGSLEEVKKNIKDYGEIDVCTFVKGWFDDTMVSFDEEIAAAYIDVDLASSTKTCLKYLYPKIVKNGVLCSQDGAFPLVIEAFDDASFWKNEVGVKKPRILGLREKVILTIRKT